MIKVLVVCGALRIGGAEKVAYELGMRRDVNKLKIDYIVFGDEVGEYEHDLIMHGCEIFHLASPGENHGKFIRTIRSIIREQKYNVVHCHTMFNSGLVLSAAKKEGVPIRIAHSHTIRASKNMGMIKEIYQAVMRIVIHKTATDYVACGNEAGEWLYGKDFYAKHGKLILNGIDVSSYAYNENIRYRIREEKGINDSFVIGHVGHMFPVKNQIFLIRLMPEILKRRQNAVLLLLGDGAERENLMKAVNDMQLQDHVIMTGNVMNVNEYLSAMDVFAFPSLYEGMPLTMIEVQSNGLPCVISDAVPQDVYLTDLLDKTSLQDDRAWIHKLCITARKNSLKYNDLMYHSGFDISTMVNKVYEIYEKAVVCN